VEKALDGDVSPSYNFGPLKTVLSVSQVVQIFLDNCGLKLEDKIISFDGNSVLESIELAVDPKKSIVELAWQSKLNSEEGIEWTAEWWEKYLTLNESPNKITSEQVAKYFST
jgi:nucleoside-diphosphate-sugar epimerase